MKEGVSGGEKELNKTNQKGVKGPKKYNSVVNQDSGE